MATSKPLAALTRAFRRWLDNLDNADLLPGAMWAADGGRAIADGVDYGLPVVMPRDVRRRWPRMTQAERSAYVEADRTHWRFQFDSPQRTGADAPVSMPNEDPLSEWDMATRRSVLENCHMAYMRNPVVNAGVNYTKAYVVGEGLRVTFKNKDVQEVLEAFMESPDNPVNEYERAFVTDLQLDGELFIRYFQDAGETVIVPLRPWEVERIETEPGFYRRPLTYHVVREVLDGTGTQETEDIPAEQVLHVAINRRAYELRGRPDVYVVLPWAKAYKDWLEDRARQNYWRNALLYTVSVDTSNPTTVAAVAARWRKPPAPGSVAVESNKVAVNAVTNPVGAGDAGEDGRQLKLMTAVGLQLPEYMLADGENANLASTNNQELPALTKFSEYQRIMVEQVWTPIFKRVLENAVNAGLLPARVPVQDTFGEPVEGEEPMETQRAFEVTYEPLSQDDVLNMAQALQIAYDNQWVSARTASTEMGYDYSVELKQLNAETEIAMQMQQERMAAGLIPPLPGQDAQGNPLPPEDEDADDEQGAQPAPAFGRAA
jgi:hypothetical protein